MSGVSPYLNPQWPEADWDVSGAFTHDRELLSFFDYCRLLLGFEPFHMVHGSPLCLWNSGRVLQHLMRSAEEIRTAGLAYEQRKIAVFLTFTNLALEEKHLADPLGNAICTFFTRHNPTKRNSVILANDLLRDHIREKFPELRLISSILKITNGGGKGNLDAYKKLADEYDDVMVHPDDVLNYDLLEKLEDKDRYILLINEYCIRNCPLRPFHYKSLSEMSLNFTGYDSSEFEKRQSKNGCQNLFTLLAHETKSVLALNTPEIGKLYDMGFRHFKLQGRGVSNASSIVFDLLRIALRNDAEDENAMHRNGQLFWESILPHPEP